MERRRSRRLLEKEIEKKKAKMGSSSSPEAVEPVIQDSPIFNPEILDVLPNIISNLDTASFARLARTCKAMNYTCFNSNNRIRIPCWDMDSVIGRANVVLHRHATNFVLFTHKEGREYSADSDFVKNLAKMPFVYEVDLEIWNRVDQRLLRELRNYFSNFPRVVIRRLRAPTVDDWEGLVEFIKDFRISSVPPATEAPLEVLSFYTQNLSEFRYFYHVPDDVILRATTKELQLFSARISEETFVELVKKFVAGDIDRWTIGRETCVDEDSDPFIAAVSEVVKVVEVEDIDRNAMEPSTAYFKPSNPELFHLLKSDGSMGSFFVFPHCVILGEL